MEPIKTLIDRQTPAESARLPEPLREIYGGDLVFPVLPDRPYVIANFVSTLDGVVSYQIPGQSGGSEISGRNEGDRFIMGLLRAVADAVLVGAETLHEIGSKHLWTAGDIRPELADLYRRCREDKSEYPLNVFISGSGKLDPERAVFHTPGFESVVITTPGGESELDKTATGRSIEKRVFEGGGRIPPKWILELLHREFGIRLLLHEGGPATLGSFVQQRLMDELFLTVAPQIAGRNPQNERISLVRNVLFAPEDAPWLKLATLKNSGDYLYLRYRADQS